LEKKGIKEPQYNHNWLKINLCVITQYIKAEAAKNKFIVITQCIKGKIGFDRTIA
jgi:hypothetical protein